MPTSGMKPEWPEAYGFKISGSGPSYVISVDRGSVAYRSGISAGDQLLEVDSHNVSEMSADAIKQLTRHTGSDPPTLGLVSRVQFKEVVASRCWGYGFTPAGVRPTIVAAVDPPGPAYMTGIRKGDIILEVNGKELTSSSLHTLDSMLQTKYGKLKLTILPRSATQNHTPLEKRSAHSGQGQDVARNRKADRKAGKAEDLFAKLNQVLGSDYQRKMTVVGLIKNYAEDRDIEKLARAVTRVLVSRQHKLLLTEIRSFVPLKHRSIFDSIAGSGTLQGLTISTVSPSETTRSTPHTHQLGTGLLAIAKHAGRIRSVCVKRSGGGFGFALRGQQPVFVESVVPGSPADRAGLKPGDLIIAVDGHDVRKCNHSELVDVLQSSGDRPLLEVKQAPLNKDLSPATRTTTSAGTRRYPAHPLYASDSGFSHNSQGTGSSWLHNDSRFTLDGHTFRQKVDLLLTTKEKMALRLALIEYNMNRNIAQLVDDGGSLLDTPAKKVLWVFILHRMSEEHKGYISKYVNLQGKYVKEMLSSGRVGSERTDAEMRKSTYTTDFLSSAQISSGSIETHESQQPMKTTGAFKQQLEYLLTSKEKSQLQQALETYSGRKNIKNFLEDVNHILDTASKQTLWFHLIPRLDPPHRAYAEQVLQLPRIQNHTNYATDMPKKEQKHQSSVFPKYGDILHLQKQFVGNFLTTRKPHESEFMSSDEDLDDLGPLHSDSSTANHIHTPSSLSSEASFAPRKTIRAPPIQGRFGSKPMFMKERNYSSDVEQATMVVNPIYAEIDHSKDSPLSSLNRPRVKRVKETAAQTTPTSTPVPPASQQSQHKLTTNPPTKHPVDFRTIVKVYGGEMKNPDIVTVFDARNANNNSSDALNDEDGDDLSPSLQYTNIDDFEIHEMESFAPHSLRYQCNSDRQGKNHNVYENDGMERVKLNTRSLSPAKRRPSRFLGQSPANVKVVINNHDQSASNSSHSLGSSYQSRALDALKALDDVVGTESVSSFGDDNVEADEDSVLNKACVPQPPAPPPPPPAPSAPTNGGGAYKSSLKLNVKRINWEKINNPSENTVWAKIEHDAADLEEMVKYLELEQQFSNKQTCLSETFRDRRTEHYILSPKKAYNISILLGHLKKGVSELKNALLGMNEDILTAELLQQLLQYMPDNKELADYDMYTENVEELSQPDQFMYLLTRVYGYEERLRAIQFKLDFTDKATEIRKSLDCVRQASSELQHSTELSRVLEVALAMGNYMNQGSSRVGQAAGFRLAFLQKVHLTKTSDGKGSFLSVLAKAVWNKYPEAIAFSLHLPALQEAVKVSMTAVEADLRELKSGIHVVSDIMTGLFNTEEQYEITDKFQHVMERFVNQASDEIQTIYSVHQTTVEELQQLMVYFGEDSTSTDPTLVFQILCDFSLKFERARQKLLLETK